MSQEDFVTTETFTPPIILSSFFFFGKEETRYKTKEIFPTTRDQKRPIKSHSIVTRLPPETLFLLFTLSEQTIPPRDRPTSVRLPLQK